MEPYETLQSVERSGLVGFNIQNIAENPMIEQPAHTRPHGCSKVKIVDPRYTVASTLPPVVSTSFTESTELFRHVTEETVRSAFSVYKKRVLSSDFATTMYQAQRPGRERNGSKPTGDSQAPTRYLPPTYHIPTRSS
jgi:hypothetical protein